MKAARDRIAGGEGSEVVQEARKPPEEDGEERRSDERNQKGEKLLVGAVVVDTVHEEISQPEQPGDESRHADTLEEEAEYSCDETKHWHLKVEGNVSKKL